MENFSNSQNDFHDNTNDPKNMNYNNYNRNMLELDQKIQNDSIDNIN